jgi:DNA-binding MarR family transcriptional regulator
MQNLTLVMGRMEARDLVLRVRSKSDRRAQVVRLSGPGARLLRRGRKIMLVLERELLHPLSASERKIFRQLLGKLTSAQHTPGVLAFPPVQVRPAHKPKKVAL